MPGHVFVVQGNLTHLACDDWLVPTDDGRHVMPAWWTPVTTPWLREAGAWRYDEGSRSDGPSWGGVAPLGDDTYDRPRPWLVSVQGDPVAHAVAFVNAAARAPRRHLARARRLIALPVVGTGAGGKRQSAGDVLAELMPALADAVASDDAKSDVVVVSYSDADFAAAQHARKRAEPPWGPWAALPDRLRRPADELAALSTRGRLVLFLGAGVGAGAGIPTWDELLERLAARAGLSPLEQAQCRALGELDRGEYIAQRLRATGGTVGTEIAATLHGYDHVGLGHVLLAGLPCSETVTTNYDRLFECASEDLGRPLAVLPYAPATEAKRWLLKMHGCVQHEDDIVLTRQSYLRYAERNAALAGIVQAMLITKHMLFVGFSLRDDNFLRIVDQVRRAVHPEKPSTSDPAQRLGTAIMLFDNPLLAELWRDEIDWVCLANEQIDSLEAARLFEVFLDYLGFCASSPAHLLDPRFEGVLSPEDVALRKLLAPLLRADSASRKASAWPAVRDLLVKLGGTMGR